MLQKEIKRTKAEIRKRIDQKKKIVKMKGTIRSNKKYWGIISQVR